MLRALALLVPLLGLGAELSPTEIVQRAADHESANQQKRREYTYRETIRQRVAKRNEHKVHDVFFIAGKEFRKLVAQDGKPLSAERAAEEQRKLEKEIEKYRRESPEKAKKRAAEEAREAREFREQVALAFDLQLVGEEQEGGRACFRIHAEPRPGFRAKGDAKLLSKLKGDIWVDKTEFHWTRVELETVEPISGLGGLVRLSKGANIAVRRILVNGEVWFPETVQVKATARAVFVLSTALEMQMSCSDFKKFSVDSKVLITGE